MKLRLKGDSIRVRLDRRDLERLVATGQVDDAVHFDPSQRFPTPSRCSPAARGRPEALYGEGRITIRIDSADAAAWLASDQRGFRPPCSPCLLAGDPRAAREGLRLQRPPPGDEADDAYAFPNPTLHC